MSALENDVPAAEADWKSECADLRRRVNLLLVALVVLSLTLTGFLALQFKRTTHDLAEMRPNASRIVELNKQETPRLQTLISKLAAYSKTHPEFATNLLVKYGVTLESKNGGGPAPADSGNPPSLETPPIATPTK